MHKFFFRLKAFRHQCLRHWLDLPPRHTYNFRGHSYKKWLGMSFERQSGKHQTNANCNNNNSMKNSNNQIQKDCMHKDFFCSILEDSHKFSS